MERKDGECRLSASGDKDLGLGVVILYKRGSGGERHSLGFLRNRMAVTTSFLPVCWGLVYSLRQLLQIICKVMTGCPVLRAYMLAEKLIMFS